MERTLTIQTCGSLAVIGAFAASEASAHLLTAFPALPLAWYVNLELFRAFEDARAETSPLRFLFGPGAFLNALAVLGLALMVRQQRHRLGVALFANVSFLFTLFLFTAWAPGLTLDDGMFARRARDGTVNVVLAFMFAASFVASALSHVSFVRAILLQRAAAPLDKLHSPVVVTRSFSRWVVLRAVALRRGSSVQCSRAPG